jgi:hypothetical protein
MDSTTAETSNKIWKITDNSNASISNQPYSNSLLATSIERRYPSEFNETFGSSDISKSASSITSALRFPDCYSQTDANNSISRTHGAICLTGQLVRLELASKVFNLIVPNLIEGFHVSLFVLLSDDVKHHRAAKLLQANRFNEQTSLYSNFSATDLKAKVWDRIREALDKKNRSSSIDNFELHVRLEPPMQENFTITGKVPVENFNDRALRKPGNAKARFMSHMRWQSGLRECMRWVQENEVREDRLFKFVMRLREDAYVFKEYIFTPSKYVGLTAQKEQGSNGVNDRYLIANRLYADKIYRGMTEDYYLDGKSHGEYWREPEMLVKRLVAYYNIELKLVHTCDFPFLLYERPYNKTHMVVRAHDGNRQTSRYKCSKYFQFTKLHCHCVPLLDF